MGFESALAWAAPQRVTCISSKCALPDLGAVSGTCGPAATTAASFAASRLGCGRYDFQVLHADEQAEGKGALNHGLIVNVARAARSIGQRINFGICQSGSSAVGSA